MPRGPIKNNLLSPVNGSAIVGASLTITVHETGAGELGLGTAATIYKGESTAEHAPTNTILSDGKGGWTQGSGSGYAEYYLEVGRFDFKVTGEGLTPFYIVQDIVSGAAGGVTTAQLAAEGVTAEKIATGAVTTAKIGTAQVTQAKMAPESVAPSNMAVSSSREAVESLNSKLENLYSTYGGVGWRQENNYRVFMKGSVYVKETIGGGEVLFHLPASARPDTQILGIAAAYLSSGGGREFIQLMLRPAGFPEEVKSLSTIGSGTVLTFEGMSWSTG